MEMPRLTSTGKRLVQSCSGSLGKVRLSPGCRSVARSSSWPTKRLRMERAGLRLLVSPRLRIELFVDDPIAVQRRALAAGAREHSPVTEEQFAMTGTEQIKRILQGAIVDPFGHIWLIGKTME